MISIFKKEKCHGGVFKSKGFADTSNNKPSHLVKRIISWEEAQKDAKVYEKIRDRIHHVK